MQRYEKYKDSAVDWIGEIPEGWEIVRFKRLFKEKKKTTNASLNSGSISFGEVVYKDDEKITEATKLSYQVLNEGEFLLNPLNMNYDLKSLRIGLSAINVVVSSGYIILQSKEGLNKNYYRWLLRMYDIVFMKTLGAGVRQTINYNDLADSHLVVPSLEEQQTIATFLDDKTAKIDQTIGNKQKEIELLKERRQILIQKAVTKGLDDTVKLKDSGVDWIGEIPEHWEVRKLKYCTKIFRGKFTHRPRNDERLYDGQYPFFQTGDIARAGRFLSNYKQTLNEFGLRVSTLFPKGTIVMTIAANIGDIAILDIDACFPDSIVGFEPKSLIIRDYLYNSLNVMKEQFMSSTIKNTQMNLNTERIGANMISIPASIEEQSQIVSYLEVIEEKIAKAVLLKQQEIEKLKEYKTVLIDNVVTGKVRVS